MGKTTVLKSPNFHRIDVIITSKIFSFKGFEKFINATERYHNEGKYDIVAGYCRSCEECKEIFNILGATKRKATEVNMFFLLHLIAYTNYT